MATKTEKLNLLSGVPLFADMSQKDLKMILESGKEVHHPAGEEIMTEGHGGIGFHLIIDGEAKVARKGKTLAKLGPGDFFGEMAVIDDGPRTASVSAVTDLTAFFVSRWEFRPILKSDPELAWKLLRHLVGRLRDEQSGRDAMVC